MNYRFCKGADSAMKERIAYVDAAKGLSILMIALGHITKIANPVDCFMSSFKVSIFYIISGFLMSYSGSVLERDFKEFTGRIIKSLVVPYCIFSAGGAAFKTLCAFLKHGSAGEVFSVFAVNALDAVFLKGINSMWFIPTLFIGEIVFFALVRAGCAVKALYAVFGVFAVTLANICTDALSGAMGSGLAYGILERLINTAGKSLAAAWFIGAGYLFYIFYRRIEDMNVKLAAGVLLSAINLVLSQINTGVDFNLMDEGSRPYLFYISGLIGSAGAIMLLDVASSHIKLTFLDYWGKNSLIVMCTHTVFGMRTVAFEGWKKVGYIPNVGNFEYIVECLAVLAILLLIEYTIVEMINKRFPFLIGKTADGGRA